jgi:hypothetical protein
MGQDERARHALYERLEDVLGTEETVTLMSLLPPTGWHDVVRAEDIKRLSTELRGELRHESAELRQDIAAIRMEMDLRFQRLETQLEGQIDVLRGELLAAFRGELVTTVTAQTRVLVLTMAGTVAALGGLALSLARFA